MNCSSRKARSTILWRQAGAVVFAAGLIALFASGASAQIAFINESHATTGTSGVDVITIATPAGAGDTLIAVLTARGQMSTFDPLNPAEPQWIKPDGTWDRISSVARNNQVFQAIFVKYLDSSGAAPSYSFKVKFDQPTTIRLAGALLFFNGVDSVLGPALASRGNDPACTQNAWPRTGVTQYNNANWAATQCQAAKYSILANGRNAPVGGAVLLGAWVHGWANVSTDQTWTYPLGMTPLASFENNSGVRGLSQFIAGERVFAAGGTGARVARPSDTGGVVHSIGQLILLLP